MKSTLIILFSLYLTQIGYSQELFSPNGTVGNSSTSNVGIGTSSPDKKLSVYSSESAIVRFHHSGSSTISGYRLGRSGSFGDIINLSSGFGIGAGTSSGNLPLSSQNTSHVDLFINGSTNNVGIGTTNPDAKLDVYGEIKLNGGAQGLSISNLTGSEQGYGNFINYGGIAINGNSGSNRQMFMFSDGSTNHNIFTVVSSTDAGVTWNPRFIIKQTGGVGIGTTSLGTHELAVEGTIGAREIKVEASGWSDFVFQHDYDLQTLEEVEQHIAEKGHLPEIPSEAEVIENGINLGEMNAKLLQKIEELTLYMIDIDKRVKELETENQELKEKVTSLEND